MGLIRTYSFNVNATASSSLTQITSAALNYKHRVIRCKCLFSQGLEDYLKVYFFPFAVKMTVRDFDHLNKAK